MTQSGVAEAFMPLMRENAPASRATEPGCRLFDICTDPDDADIMRRFVLDEDSATFEARRTTAHYWALFVSAARMMRALPQFD